MLDVWWWSWQANAMTTTHTMTESDTRKMQAYWWAAGVADITGTPDRAFDFSLFAEAEARAYYMGEVSFLSSIRDQWARFTDGADPIRPVL